MENKSFWDKKAITRKGPENPVVKAFIEDKIESLLNIVPHLNKKSLLDFGCGNGRFLYYLQKINRRVAGLDISSKMIEMAKKNVNVPLFVNDGLKTRFEDNSFDISFGACYIHNLTNYKDAINEMKRVAKGYIILIEPNPLNPIIFLFNLFSPEERFFHVVKFNKRYLKKLFEEAELEVIYLSKGGFITPNKTPKFLLPILKKIGFLNFIGCYITIVGKKHES